MKKIKVIILKQDQYGNLIGSLNYGTLTENKGIEVGSAAHRRAWESGHIDYFGRDSFSNIQQQLEKNIQLNSFEYHPAQQRQTTTDKQIKTNNLKNSDKQSLTSSQPLTNNHQNLIKQTTNNHDNLIKQTSNNSLKSALKESSTTNVSGQSTNLGKNSSTSLQKEQTLTTVNVSQNISHQPTTTSIVKSSTPSNQHENLQFVFYFFILI